MGSVAKQKEPGREKERQKQSIISLGARIHFRERLHLPYWRKGSREKIIRHDLTTMGVGEGLLPPCLTKRTKRTRRSTEQQGRRTRTRSRAAPNKAREAWKETGREVETNPQFQCRHFRARALQKATLQLTAKPSAPHFLDLGGPQPPCRLCPALAYPQNESKERKTSVDDLSDGLFLGRNRPFCRSSMRDS